MGEKPISKYYGTDIDITASNPKDVGLKHQLDIAADILNKDLSGMEIKQVIKEITDFIESNISNDSMKDDIDTLTDIKKELKK